ncbi:hypothetical protein PM082_006222 [Marasmius tenuissimus]|nr:hypothetical protein PM082_006222 [Marasmius tenuissimus]
MPFTTHVNSHSLGYAHLQQGCQSQIPFTGYDVEPLSYGYRSHPASSSSINIPFDRFGTTSMQAPNPLTINAQPVERLRTSDDSMTMSAIVSTSPSFDSYSIAEHTLSSNDRTAITMDFAYTDPITYAVSITTFGYNDNTGENAGSSAGISQSTPSAAANSSYPNAGYDSTP